MKRKHIDAIKDLKLSLRKNPKLMAEYRRLQPEFMLIRKVIEARMKRDLTQKN